ncbi:DUF6127 family protein [Sedimentitalea sp.]
MDIHDLRSIVDCVRIARRTAIQTAFRMITAGATLPLLRRVRRADRDAR